MTYKELLKEITDRSELLLPVETEEKLFFEFKKSKTNLDECDILRIHKIGATVGADVNLKGLYDSYPNEPLEFFIANIISVVNNVCMPAYEYATKKSIIDALPDIESRIFLKPGLGSAVDPAGKNIPHIDIGDMTFYPSVDCTDAFPRQGGKTSINLDRELISELGLTEEKVMEVGRNNANDLSNYKLMTMDQILFQGDFGENLLERETPYNTPDDELVPMFVLTSVDRIIGSVAILSDETLDHVAKVLDGSYVILPSSIHEVLVLPDRMGADMSYLAETINFVNETEVATKDRLSNLPYHYDAIAKKLEPMADYEKRVSLEPEKKKESISDSFQEGQNLKI